MFHGAKPWNRSIARLKGEKHVDQEELEKYREECLAVTPELVEEEFIRNPGDIAFWSDRYAEALEEDVLAYANRKAVYGRLVSDLDLIAELEDNLGKKPTASQIEGAVVNHEDYREAVAREGRAKATKQRHRGMMDALSAKRDALISLGADVRIERQRDALIRDDD